MNAKIELLTAWVMMLFAAVVDAPVWVKTTSYVLGSLAALSVIIRFILDWKYGNFKKKE